MWFYAILALGYRGFWLLSSAGCQPPDQDFAVKTLDSKILIWQEPVRDSGEFKLEIYAEPLQPASGSQTGGNPWQPGDSCRPFRWSRITWAGTDAVPRQQSCRFWRRAPAAPYPGDHRLAGDRNRIDSVPPTLLACLYRCRRPQPAHPCSPGVCLDCCFPVSHPTYSKVRLFPTSALGLGFLWGLSQLIYSGCRSLKARVPTGGEGSAFWICHLFKVDL